MRRKYPQFHSETVSGQGTTSAPAYPTEIWLQARVSPSGNPPWHSSFNCVLLNTQVPGTSQPTALPLAAGVERKCCRGSVKQGCPCSGSTAQAHGDPSVASLLGSYSRPSLICGNSKGFQLFFPPKHRLQGWICYHSGSPAMLKTETPPCHCSSCTAQTDSQPARTWILPLQHL